MSPIADDWQAKARTEFDNVLAGISAAWAGQVEQSRRTSAEAARNQLSEDLNQGLRRLRVTQNIAGAVALASELTVAYAERCAIFLFGDGQAHAETLRGLGDLPFAFAPDEAAAFRAAVESGDPVVAVGTPSEISPGLAERVGTEVDERVHLFPMAVRGEVKAVLFAAGDVQASALELIAGITAMQMEVLSAPAAVKREDLLSIGNAATTVPSVKTVAEWKDLSPEMQALHLRAQRMARLRVAEMRLEHAGAMNRGVERRDLYAELREPIDRAREEFRREFIQASPTMVDYLYLQLVHSLVHDDDRLLGAGFPGPLV